MNKIAALLLVMIVLALPLAATADINNWQIKCGITGNVYPYGNDFATRFGVDPLGTFKFDTQDSVHPTISEPYMDLAFIYKPYQSCYTTNPGGYTWTTGGWLKKSGVQVDSVHGPGLPSVGWPSSGLIKDTRAPMTPFLPEYWKVTVQAPQLGETIKFAWEVNQEPGLEAPLDGFMIKVLANSDLAAAGITGDLDLLQYGAGKFQTAPFPQFGLDFEDLTVPIMHTWIIEAYGIPEPGTILLMAAGVLGLGGLIRRRA